MKQLYYVVLLLLILPLFLLAQPIITRDWVGGPGEVIRTAHSKVIPDVSPTGVDAYWDFSLVTEDTIRRLDGGFVTLESTQFYADFPDANTCLHTSYYAGLFGIVQEYEYSTVTDDRWEILGDRSVIFDGSSPFMSTDFQDPRIRFKFPFGYESTFRDTFAARSLSFWDSTRTSRGTLIFEGVGYGTVALPNEDVPNTLQVAYHETRVDSNHLMGPLSVTKYEIDGYVWVSPDVFGPIAEYQFVVSTRFTDLDSPEMDSTVNYDTTFTFNLITVPVRSVMDRAAIEITVAPNPFRNSIRLNYELVSSEEVYFNVFNINGQLVHSMKLDGLAGTNRVEVDLGQLDAGNYFGTLQVPGTIVPVKLVKVD